MTRNADEKIFWFDMALFPVALGLCTSEGTWKKEMRRTGRDAEWLEGGACAMTMAFDDASPLCIMVQFGERSELTLIQRIGVVAHEAQHVWQFMREHMLHTQQQPDRELEAYTVQWLLSMLLEVLQRRGKVAL